MDPFPTMRTQTCILSVRQLNREARGVWSLPAYQRPLVWAPEQALALVQSVHEGYPIGSLLVWEQSWRGPYLLLDGQQRVAALTGIRCGTTEAAPAVGWSISEGRWCLEPSDPEDWISIRWRFETDPRELHRRFRAFYDPACADEQENALDLALSAFDRLENAVVAVHVLQNATAAEAVEAFRRLNTGGTPIDPDLLERLLSAEEGS